MFGWFDFVYYKEQDENETRLARWLGPATGYGDGACHWILPINCKPLVQGTVWTVPDDDYNTDERRKEMDRFDKEIASKLETILLTEPRTK